MLITAQGQAEHWSAGGEQFHCASLVIFFYSLSLRCHLLLMTLLLLLLLLIISIIKLFLCQTKGFTSFSLVLLPISPEGGV